MLYFTQLPRRLLWTDFHQQWNRCSTRNQSLQIICQSVQGFDFTGGGRFSIFTHRKL